MAFAFCSQVLSDPILTVRPQFVMAGRTVYVLCRVPRNEANRSVRYGLDPYAVSSRDINGIDGPAVFEKYIEDVGCPGPAEAFCEVTRNDGKKQRSVRPIEVKGCAGEDSDSGFTDSTP